MVDCKTFLKETEINGDSGNMKLCMGFQELKGEGVDFSPGNIKDGEEEFRRWRSRALLVYEIAKKIHA